MSARPSHLGVKPPQRRPRLSLAHRLRWRWSQMSLRWHVALIMLATTLVAPAFGKLLLLFGVSHMAWRFGIVVLASYAVFLLLVRLWIWLMTPRRDVELDLDVEDAADAIDIGLDIGGRSLRPAASETSSAAGDIGGGLADIAGGFADEGAAILIVLAIIGAILLCIAGAGVYVVWIGPELLIEAALASLVAAGVLRRSDVGGADHWLTVVIGRTWWIVLATLLVAALLGAYLESTQPETQTLMQGVKHLMGPR